MEELFGLAVDPGEAFFAVARAEFGEEFAEAAFEGFLDASHLRLIYHGATRTEGYKKKRSLYSRASVSLFAQALANYGRQTRTRRPTMSR